MLLAANITMTQLSQETINTLTNIIVIKSELLREQKRYLKEV